MTQAFNGVHSIEITMEAMIYHDLFAAHG